MTLPKSCIVPYNFIASTAHPGLAHYELILFTGCLHFCPPCIIVLWPTVTFKPQQTLPEFQDFELLLKGSQWFIPTPQRLQRCWQHNFSGNKAQGHKCSALSHLRSNIIVREISCGKERKKTENWDKKILEIRDEVLIGLLDLCSVWEAFKKKKKR